MGSMDHTTIEEIRGKTTKTITNDATGNTFLIGRIMADDLWAEGILVSEPAEGGPSGVDPATLALPFPPIPVEMRQRAIALQRAAVIRGLRSIRVVEENPAVGEIAYRELDPRDVKFVADAVLEFSGIIVKKLEDEEAPADKSFRDQSAA